MANSWRFKLLGGLSASFDGRVAMARPRTRRQAALLSYLLLHPEQAHPREVLADRFWPDVAPDAARASLRNALAILRRLLEGEGLAPAGSVLVASGNSSIWLDTSQVATDVVAFQSALDRGDAAEAVRLYGGPLLAGLDDAPGAAEWLLPERARLDAAYADALARLKRASSSGGSAAMLSASSMATARHSGGSSRYSPGEGGGRAATAAATLEREEEMPAALLAPAVFLPPPSPLRFFGREDEIAALEELLGAGSAAVRLVNLTGPGGSGKTRLALEAARRISEEKAAVFPGGICFVPLVDLQDPERLSDAVAGALGLPRLLGAAPLDQVASHFAGAGQGLLVLDNLEHLLPDVAERVVELLVHVPQVVCLLTSRTSLGIEGERELPVKPLAVPPVERFPAVEDIDPGAPEQLLRYASVRLFMDRARVARPDFSVTARTAADVARLCAHLEGLPLALELASTWAVLLSPGALVTRLEEEGTLELLTAPRRRRDLAGRHATLRATIAWSRKLLPAGVAGLLARLSVFRGGWSLEAAEAVCGEGEDTVLEALAILSDHSFITAREEDDRNGGRRMRYRMLEPIREFAAEELGEVERVTVQGRHLDWMLSLTREASEAVRGGPDQAFWLARLEDEHDNLRAALDRAPGLDRLEDGLRLIGYLWRFWEARSHFREGRARAVALLRLAEANGAPPTAPAVRARAHVGAGNLSRGLGDFTAAEDHLHTAVALAQEAGDVALEAGATSNLASAFLIRNESDTAAPLYERSVTLARAVGERGTEAASLANLANLAFRRSEHDRAEEWGRQALVAYREIGDRVHEATILSNLAMVAIWRGDHAGARAPLSEALALHRALGNRQGEALALGFLAVAAARAGVTTAARALAEKAVGIQRAIGNREGEGYCLAAVALARRVAGEWAESEEWARRSEAIYSEIGSPLGVAGAVAMRALCACARGDYATALSLAERALAGNQEVGYAIGQVDAHLLIGVALAERGAAAMAAAAQAHIGDALRLAREASTTGSIAEALCEQAALLADTGDTVGALTTLKEARAEAVASTAPAIIVRALDETATVLMDRGADGDAEKAVRLWAAADAERARVARATEWDAIAWDDPAEIPPPEERLPLAPSPYDRRQRHARRRRAARIALGAGGFQRAVAEGAALSREAAIALAEE